MLKAGKAALVLCLLSVMLAAGCIGQPWQSVFNPPVNQPNGTLNNSNGNLNNQAALPSECDADWRCNNWSACSAAGIQTRDCIDSNYCGTGDGRPPLSRACVLAGAAVNYISSDLNREPYYRVYCDKIDAYDLGVRTAAAQAIRNDSGGFSPTQLIDVYDWVRQHIVYQTVPLAGIPYPPGETLTTGSGDCKNMAVLVSSMVKSIGGQARVVLDDGCQHAYTLVYLGSSQLAADSFTHALSAHYGTDVSINYITSNGTWAIFDPIGGAYPGSTLRDCTGDRTVHFVTSCLDCAQQLGTPYTYGDRCYASCPNGTVTANQYYCRACNPGYYSCNDQCTKCPAGLILYNDCLCHNESASPGSPPVNPVKNTTNGTDTFSGFEYVVPIDVDYAADGTFNLLVENRAGEAAEITSMLVDGKELADFKGATLDAAESAWLTGGTGTAGNKGDSFSVSVEMDGTISGKLFYTSGTVSGIRS